MARILGYFRVIVLVVHLMSVDFVHLTEICTEKQFMCNSRKCITRDLKCDGKDDCGDLSDEINCTNRGKCDVGEFECSEGGCILSTLLCNGKWDCPRGLDEINCEIKSQAPTTPSPKLRGLFHTATGNTIIHFPVYEQSPGVSIYVRFLARRCTGHLLEMTSQNTDQFFLLTLTGDGNIEFLFKTLSGPGVIIIPPPHGGSFCNGKIHMLTFKRYLEKVYYRVNRGRSVTKMLGLLSHPFSRPFRMYVGSGLEGCVSGIDIVYYRSKSDMHSVGVSKGCAVQTRKTTTSLPVLTSVNTFQTEENPVTRTRIRKESVVHTDPSTRSPDLLASSHSPTTEPYISTHARRLVTQSKRVTHRSSMKSHNLSKHGSMNTTEGPYAQTSGLVTQSKVVTQPQSTTINLKSTLRENNSHSSRVTEQITGKGTTNTTIVSFGKLSSTSHHTSPSTTLTHEAITNAISRNTKCEPIRTSFCAQMGYSQTALPNRMGHTSQGQAYKEMRRFIPYIRATCSSVLKDFICATYLPPCSGTQTTMVLPCYELCAKSKYNCASLMEAFEFRWPESLDCEELPNRNEGTCTMGRAYRTPPYATPTQDPTEVYGKTLMENLPTSSGPTRKRRCGGMLRHHSGVITSPNYPMPYLSDTICKWTIILPKVYHVIDVALEEVSLETDANCGYDYLLFLDGLSNQVGPRVCGFMSYPRVVTIKGNEAMIVFRSDSALNKQGFLIKYTAHWE